MRVSMAAVVLWSVLCSTACFAVAGYDDFRFISPFTKRVSANTVKKIDLLFVVDESRNTQHRHAVLQATLDSFLGRLLNPPCVDSMGMTTQAADPLASCPEGSQREFVPVLDIHIGVVTTSLGGHGADACTMPAEDRKAHLVSDGADSYQGLGFLAWDPAHAKVPQGESDADAITASLVSILDGLGALGCGYEAPLEAWYRFLVEPDPHEAVEVVDGQAELVGTDNALLAQRAAFLRSDSLLTIVMLSDENDCSIRDGGQSYFVAQIFQPGSTGAPFRMPKPRAACATDPQSVCCRSCGQAPGDGCDTTRDDCGMPYALPPELDSINLRCFDQKRRFGIDFLWPVDRYVTGLTSPEVSDRFGNLVSNPLLAARDPAQVLLSGIVGVPWQDIARRDGSGVPDLEYGRDARAEPVGGFMNASELRNNAVWKLILADPLSGVTPRDPHMIESIEPRSGAHPWLADAAIAPPTAAYDADVINGHELPNADRSALQYACVHDLVVPTDCANGSGGGGPVGCECAANAMGNPLCWDSMSNQYGSVQFRAGAQPGVRQLQVLEAIGPQAVVGSACWVQATDPAMKDYGYNAAIFRAIIDRLAPALRGQFCFGEELVVEENRARCTLLEARRVEGQSCDCLGPARQRPSDDLERIVEVARQDALYATEQWNCYCEIAQASGNALDACQLQIEEPVTDTFGLRVDGWCLIDAQRTPPIGSSALAAGCAAERRLVRLVGDALPLPDAALFLDCR